ncbi:MAG: hypothetical protein AB7I42_29565 [Bradyrhizobium sp.]|uniref:hypothetical protein n=1 Tax=Bradyrhizobium sp. TaxID=376 RepID=UPI003D0A0B3A
MVEEIKTYGLGSALKALYDAEINVEMVSFWDSGWTVRMGDKRNGFRSQKTFEGRNSLEDIGPWLLSEAARLYPHFKRWRPHIVEPRSEVH